MKAVIAEDSDRILGFTMIGPEAGEVMATVQTAMLAGLPYRPCVMQSSRTRRWWKDWGRSLRMCQRGPRTAFLKIVLAKTSAAE